MARTEMILRDMIQNPPGAYTRQIAARYTIRDALRAKFVAAMADPKRRRRFRVQVSGSEPEFTAWVKVPSETYDVDYDVIFNLHFDEGVRTATGARVRLYCNAPSWIFTYGYVARSEGILAPGWDGALGLAATDAPNITNPSEDVGYDKVVFQAILFLLGPGGFVSLNDFRRGSGGAAPNPKDASLSGEAKLFEYKRAKQKYDAAKRVEKRAEQEAKRQDEKRARETARSQRSSAKAAKTISSTKKSRQAAAAGRKKSR